VRSAFFEHRLRPAPGFQNKPSPLVGVARRMLPMPKAGSSSTRVTASRALPNMRAAQAFVKRC